MITKRFLRSAISILLFALAFQLKAQQLIVPSNYPKYVITENNSPEDQYLFLGTRPTLVKYPSYLVVIDNYGTPVFYRYLTLPSGGFAPESNNRLSFWSTTSTGNTFYIIDAFGNLSDSVKMQNYTLDNHDFVAMDNGHYLIFGLDTRITNMSLVVTGGKTNASVSGCVIQELDENKNVVFEWNSWNHFQITDSYEDLTKSSIDLVHPNSIEIDKDGNILLIGRTMDEITKINRATGNIIWRMGGKNNQFTFTNPGDAFSWPHDFRQISDNHYTLFDNGKNRLPPYSRGIEYVMDEANKKMEKVWEYDVNKQVYSPSGGSTRRLPSGNTIIGFGGQVTSPAAIEVHPDGSKAFQLNFIGDLSSGRAVRADWKTSLFVPAVDNIDFGEWDGYTENSVFLLTVNNNSGNPVTLTSYSTRTDAFYINKTFPVVIPANGQIILPVVFYPINIHTGLVKDVLTLNSDVNTNKLVQRVARQVKLSGTQYDATAPVADIPVSGKNKIPRDTTFYITFSEPVRWSDNSEFSFANVDNLITFKKQNASGENVAFDAVISTDRKKITIKPVSSLAHTQTYYLAVKTGFEDYSNNAGAAKEALFNTVDLTAPVVTITPANGAAYTFLGGPVTIRYNEPVRNIDNTDITVNYLKSIISFKSTDINGANVSFTPSISADKTTVTVTPDSYLSPLAVYYAAIQGSVEDFNNNIAPGINTTFTTGSSTGVAPLMPENSVKIYPNPGNGVFRIELKDQKTTRFRVTDINGRIVYDETIPGVSDHYIDLRNQADGIFFLKIEQSGYYSGQLFKLIKQND